VKIGDTFTEDGLIYSVIAHDGENFVSKLVGFEKEEPVKDEPVKEESKDYDGMQYSQLKQLCASKGLSAKGSKQELIDRLRG